MDKRKKEKRDQEESSVEFYDTENSEISKGQKKVIPKGLDSFGEEDTFDPDEADEHQTYRDRNQNSDLKDRFYTHGMKIDSKDLESEKQD